MTKVTSYNIAIIPKEPSNNIVMIIAVKVSIALTKSFACKLPWP